ncbi:hypothetical protein DEJ21_01215 [Curtobacterium sp. MCSS17_006]|nr:hypothetical protein DEJ21_01215 [Curtobacterium sp. MCSS17_006]
MLAARVRETTRLQETQRRQTESVRESTADWTFWLMTSDIARSEVRPTDPARLERAATLAMLRAGRILTG